MKNKHLVILAIVAVIMVILTAVITGEHEKQSESFVRGSYLVQGLNPEKVVRIYMERYGDTVEFTRASENFIISSKWGYPAKSERVNDIFYAVSGITCAEKVTSNPENHTELGVDGREESTIIRFFGKDDKKLIGLIIGKPKENDQKLRTYVRLEGENDVYLSQNFISYLSCDYGGYISERILPGEKENYSSVSIVNRKGDLRFLKEGEHFSLKSHDLGEKEDQKKIDDFLDKAVRLRIFDILKADDASDIVYDAGILLKRDDKSAYTVKLGEKNGKCYVSTAASFENEGAEITISKDEPEESLKKKEALLIARDSVQEFNDFNKGWVYEVDKRYLEYLNASSAEFIEDEKASPENKTNAD
ncbi:MAG: DUF4340 domain-containing protein [Syntrophales bacterium]|jgi:hypothetical protein|nr:DUF4340 domain-containing protein [Syntrophales bacterium]MDY0043244.1 DUF4340 domain-containing protein [Syntrophales bacterium]